MPVKIKAFSCQFKCGAKVQTVKARMQKHENKCWLNPAKKACVACVNFDQRYDSDDYQSWRENICKAGLDIDLKLKHNCVLFKHKIKEAN